MKPEELKETRKRKGKELKETRKRLGLSRKKAELKLGGSYSAWGTWERGERPIPSWLPKSLVLYEGNEIRKGVLDELKRDILISKGERPE